MSSIKIGDKEADSKSEDYNNGLKCSYLGKSVKDMSEFELISFIGQLDFALTQLQRE